MMVYLDNAATSHPKPKEVQYAAAKAMILCGNPGRSSHRLAITGAQVLAECRLRLAKLFNIEDETRFIFCLNCTDALNIAIKGMMQAGGHVVTTALEHNSVLRPLSTMQVKNKIAYTVVLPGAGGVVGPEDIEWALRPDTRLVVLTHASNVTGAIQPVGEIVKMCRQKKIYTLIDAAQTAGKIKIDLNDLQADLVAFPGHKGLLGPMGSGVLYVKKDCPIATFREGGTGSASMCLYQPFEMPDYLESGTPALSAISGLAAGVWLINKNFEEYRQQAMLATEYLFDGLSGIEEVVLHSRRENNAGVITFTIRDVPSYAAANALDEFHICCRAGYHCAPLCHKYLGTQNEGAIRFSTGPFNTLSDVRTAVDAVKKIIYLNRTH